MISNLLILSEAKVVIQGRMTAPATYVTKCNNKWRVDDRLFGIVVSTSDCHPRGPVFDSRLHPRNFSGSIGSGTGSTQPREDKWVATWLRSSEIQLRKLKLMFRDKRFANHNVPCTAIWQQPLQSVLALRSCSATDLILMKSGRGKGYKYHFKGQHVYLMKSCKYFFQ